MDWKKIFLLDLATLLPGGKRGTGSSPEVGDLWFVRPLRWLKGERRTGRVAAACLQDSAYRPGAYYRRRGRRWAGPVYMSGARWRRDLLDVTGQLTAIARTNAPLPKGLEVAAREENRLNHQMSPRHMWNLLAACSVAAAVFVAGTYVGAGLLDRITLTTVAYFSFVGLLGVAMGAILLNRSGRTEAVLLTLRDGLASGLLLSESMCRLHRFFPRFYVDLVKAGEDTGGMIENLDAIGEDTVRSISLIHSVRHNFVYLGTVLCIQLLLLTFICLKVAPVFVEILRDVGAGPPAPLVWAVGAVDAIAHAPHGSLLIVGCVAALAVLGLLALRLRRRRHLCARPLASFMLFVPGLHGLLVKQNLATAALILEKLLKAGMPMDDALESTAASDLNPLYAATLRRVRARVLEGESLSQAFEATRGLAPVPGFFRGMIAMGERSGMLPEALARVSDIYGAAVVKRTRVLADAIMPVGVLGLGFLTLMAELGLLGSLISITDSMLY